MRDAPNASAGVYQHHTSMLRAASSRPAHSVATGRHNTAQGIRASMVDRSTYASPAVVHRCASIIHSGQYARSAGVAQYANIISVRHSVRPASVAQYANMDVSDIIAIHAHR